MKIHTFLLSFVPILQLCTSYPLDTPHTRRASLQRALDLSTGAAAVGASLVVIALPTQASAVLSSKPCVAGIGDGCVDLATDNDLIRSLQMQSAAKREVYAKESRNAYYMKNYPDWFASIGKNLVKKSDGTFITVTDMELDQLKKDGRLTVEIPKAKGGKFTDVTQRPINVLKD